MELLLEIRTEEMPASHVQAGLTQLCEKLLKELKSQNLIKEKEKEVLQTFGTCRRLIVHGNIGSSQKDREETVLGPPRKAAFDKQGKPTRAAEGFARSQNVAVDDLEVIQDERGEYAGVKKIKKGKTASELLKDILPRIIESLSFPKMMRWGSGGFRFSRPIKGILCLCGGRCVEFESAGVKTSAVTYGHKLFSQKKITPENFQEYKQDLEKNLVLIDADERRQRILDQAERVLQDKKARIYPDEELLEKLSYDVEYPYVIAGEFPSSYLKLPIEVLSTAMKVGQSLFSVIKDRRQLPVFIGVTDACPDSRSLVKMGNERVLQARLEDARFFWEQDIQVPIKKRTAQLKKIVFQEKLGSYADKTQRITQLTAYLANKVAAREKSYLKQAAELCKTDLLTELVREFPSLQGKAGGLYAREEGYSPAVWKAVYDHYKPVNMEDSVPSTLNGALLSLADKFDSVIGVFGIGVQISGSRDPFGLRRDAQGICMIILEHELDFSFPLLINKAVALYQKKLIKSKAEIEKRVSGFFQNRLEYIFQQKEYRYDLVNAALGAGMKNIYHVFLRLEALDRIKDEPEFKSLIQTAKRVNNILKELPSRRLNAELLEAKEERELHTTHSIIKENIEPLVKKGQYGKAQRMIMKIQPVVDNFFDQVMVMDKDIKIRNNRLALLQGLRKTFFEIADYSQVVIES